jgi:RNA polymerase sigma-70 factor (ECF subfamily)
MASNADQTWLPQALRGDEDAFAQLVEQYQTPVYNLCYRMLGDGPEAEDAAQETFWRAFQAIKRYDPQRSFATWLLSIAAHYCIDQQRRRRVPVYQLDEITEEITPDPAEGPEKATARSEEQAMLHRMLKELGPQDRAAIILRYWYDLSDQEIGESLNLTVSAVKSRLHRARLLLAQRWQATQTMAASQERTKYESPAF